MAIVDNDTLCYVLIETRLIRVFGLNAGHLQNAKIKVQSAKLRNPELIGMGVLVVASFSISRILYLLDVYYTRWTGGCQVKFFINVPKVGGKSALSG